MSCTLNLKQCQITLIAARWASWFHFIQPNFAKVIQLYPPFDQCQITLIAARWDGLLLCTFTQPKFVKKILSCTPLMKQYQIILIPARWASSLHCNSRAYLPPKNAMSQMRFDPGTSSIASHRSTKDV